MRQSVTETGLQPEEAKALSVYVARDALLHALPAEADDTEWLTPEQTEIVWATRSTADTSCIQPQP